MQDLAPAPSQGTNVDEATVAAAAAVPSPAEIGGPAGLEPTRYGDWERAGRCIDF